MLATILLSILLWLIGAIYAAIHLSLPGPAVGSIGVKKGIILGLTFNSMTSHSVDNKFSISLVRGVLGCNRWTGLVVVKILSVLIFLQCVAYLVVRYDWFFFRLRCLCLMKLISCWKNTQCLNIFTFFFLPHYSVLFLFFRVRGVNWILEINICVMKWISTWKNTQCLNFFSFFLPHYSVLVLLL